MKRNRLPDEVMNALKLAQRAPGWNLRPRDVRRFDLPGGYGHGCTLLVVPFRRWAYRRAELQTAAYQEWAASKAGEPMHGGTA